MKRSTQLRRNIANRRIAGVAAGLSDFLGIDVTLIRVLFVLSTLFSGGAGPLIYVVLWLVLPQSTSAPALARTPRSRLAWVLVAVALFIGFISMVGDGYTNIGSIATPIIGIIVLVLAVTLWRKMKGRPSWKTHKEFQKARLAWQRRLDEHANHVARPTQLGGDPFQIDSFYPEPPSVQGDSQEHNSGFQIQ